MILKHPPKHFTPEWLPRMRERSERAWTRRILDESFKQQSAMLERQMTRHAVELERRMGAKK